jgi:hypothetical protein
VAALTITDGWGSAAAASSEVLGGLFARSSRWDRQLRRLEGCIPGHLPGLTHEVLAQDPIEAIVSGWQ